MYTWICVITVLATNLWPAGEKALIERMPLEILEH